LKKSLGYITGIIIIIINNFIKTSDKPQTNLQALNVKKGKK